MRMFKLKPKVIAHLIYPLLVAIIILLLSVILSDFKNAERTAHDQANDNVNVATDFLEQYFSAITNQLFLLGKLYQIDQTPEAFLSIANQVVNSNKDYLEIGLLTPDSSYFATNGYSNLSTQLNLKRPWNKSNAEINTPYLSAVYISESSKRATAAMVLPIENDKIASTKIVFEIDLAELYLSLSQLKTLSDGYVYIIEMATGNIILHPSENVIGTASDDIIPALFDEIRNTGITQSRFNYTYDNEEKFSVYHISEQLDWAILSGTSNQDIGDRVFNIDGISIALVSIIILISLMLLVLYRMHLLGRDLTQECKLENLQESFTRMGLQICGFEVLHLLIYDEYTHSFQHIESNDVYPAKLLDFDVSNSNGVINTIKYNQADELMRHLNIHSTSVRIPLLNNTHIIGIIYLTKSMILHPYFIAVFRNYAQSALINALLTQKIRNEDSMTGLMNKSFFRQQLALKVSDTSKTNYVAMIDIDNFKKVNDTYGHLFGDRVIIAIANLIKDSFSMDCVSARYGGEEFIVMFNEDTDECAFWQLEQLRVAIAETIFEFDMGTVAVTASIGFSRIIDNVDKTISLADKALYRAKTTNKNKVLQQVA